MPKERTYIMIKPDGVQRGLIGTIISRFETKGFKLVAMKLANQERPSSRSTTLISPQRDSSLDSSSTPPPDQSAAWSGRVITPSLPEERCSVPPSHSIPSQELSEVISALMSEETSSTDPMPLSPPTRRSLFGSPQRSSSTGHPTPRNGFTSDQSAFHNK